MSRQLTEKSDHFLCWLVSSCHLFVQNGSQISVTRGLTFSVAISDALDAYDASVIAKKEREDILPSDLNRPEKHPWLFKLKQKPAYIGVTYSKKHRKYLAQRRSKDGKLHELGYYKFEADAALAVDKGSVLGTEGECNFKSDRSTYEKHARREMEAEANGRPVDARYDAVVEKVSGYLSQIYDEIDRDATVAELDNHKGRDRNDGELDSIEAEDNAGGSLANSAPYDTGQNSNNMSQEEAMSSGTSKSKVTGTDCKTSLTNLACSERDRERPKSTTTEASDMNPKSKKRYSKFTGVTSSKNKKSYVARIRQDSKVYHCKLK